MRETSIFLMSPPGPGWALRGRANFRSAAAPDVDASIALAEWVALADALEARGGRVVSLIPPDDSLTGLPFAAEAGHFVTIGGRRSFLLPNMAKPHRRGERRLWRETALALRLEPIDVPGIWEAQGDIAQFRGRTLLFFGGRTDRQGAEGAARFFEHPLFVQIREPAFHGNMALLPLPHADKLLACRDVIDAASWRDLVSAFGEERIEPVSEPEIRAYATNGLPIGGHLLAPSLLPPRVRALVESWGIEVKLLSMGELCGKAGGAARCLVSEATVGDDFVIPPHLDYRERRGDLMTRLS